jgi:hypothetical protein
MAYPPVQEGVIQRAFGAGELAPVLHARADNVKYTTGLRTCRNFLVSNRAGTRYIGTCKTNSPTVQLIPYLSELAGESMVIECGSGYLRFFKNGAAVNVAGVPAWNGATPYVPGDVVSNGGVNYWAKQGSLNQAPPNATYWAPLTGTLLEIPTVFGSTDLPYWSQSGRTITLTHELHPPQELTYQSVAHWSLTAVNTAPTGAPPTGLVLTPGGAGARRFAYVVTVALASSYEESIASGVVVNLGCAQPTEAAPNVLTWTPVVGAVEYYVYCDPYGNGTFGFLGTATGAASFNDVGFVPDFTITPPLPRVLFASAGNYPKVSTTYKQRRFFGYTINHPDGIDASRVGFPSNFAISSPLQDDDALAFTIAGGQHNPVRHLVGLKPLIVLTDAGEWSVVGENGVLAPNTIIADQQTFVGCAPIRPVVVGNSIIYVQARGSILRDLQFDIAVEGLAGRDLTVFSSHLVDGHTIRALTFAQAPHSIVWAVREDGVLLGLTYLREQEVWGWHRHDTDGFFWDACAVAEATGDMVYCIVRRTINGATVRYLEKLEKREIGVFDVDCFFVDAGLSYSGPPVGNVAGLDHLEAKRVAVVGDGAVISDGVTGTAYVVTGGTLVPALPATYANIHVGLPILVVEIETLDLDVQGANVRDKQKRLGGLDVLIDQSSRSFKAGPDENHLIPYAPPLYEPASDTFTGQVELNLTSAFNRYGRVLIRQTDPLPLTILGVIPHVELGG